MAVNDTVYSATFLRGVVLGTRTWKGRHFCCLTGRSCCLCKHIRLLHCYIAPCLTVFMGIRLVIALLIWRLVWYLCAWLLRHHR